MKTNNILSRIIENKRLEVDFQKQSISLEELKSRITHTESLHSMREALKASSTGIIAEFKRRSPSKGWINPEAKIADIIPNYQASGATALSILTDKDFFGGHLRDVCMARPLVNTPILRKEFIVDEYQLYQSKLIGADAILLIASALEQEQCREFTEKAHQLGLEVLLEIHSEDELKYIQSDTDMVGVNNRDLKTFQTTIENSLHLVSALPKGSVWISESGISGPQDVAQLRTKGFRGFLIGETFMRTENPGLELKTFINQL